MAGNEDGTDFTALDTNIVGDGSGDSTTKPLGTMLENLEDARQRYLRNRASRVTKSWFNSYQGEVSDRPLATATRPMMIATVPIEVRQGIKEIHTSLLGDVDCDGPNTSPKLDTELEFFLKQTGKFSTSTRVTSSGRQVITNTLDLSSESFSGVKVGCLQLWIQSAASESISDGTITAPSGTADWWRVKVDDTTTFESEIDERTTLERQTAPVRQFEVIHKSNADGNGDRIVGIMPAIPGDNVTVNGEAADVLEISYIRPEKLAIDIRYKGDSSTQVYAPKQPNEMEPKEPAIGADVGLHAQNLDGQVRTPVCRAIGPHGQDQGDDWPTDYYRQHSWSMVSEGDDTVLDRASFQPRYDDSVIRCVCYVKAMYDQRAAGNPAGGGSYFDHDPIAKSDYLGDIATADMDLKITMRQAQTDASWSSQSSISNTETFEDEALHRIRPQNHFPLVNTWYWSRNPQAGSNQPSGEFRWAHMEGMVSRSDFELFGVTGKSLTIDTSNLSFTRDEPVRLDLEFDQWSKGPDTDEVAEFGRDASYKFGVVCVGTSWWELPQI